jgi:predicted phage terminase large subunit-like protein
MPDAPKIVTPADAAAELQERKKAKQSLYEFLRQGWSTIEGTRLFRDGWALGAVCEHLQAVVEGEIQDFLLNIPPRMTKSTAGSVCLTPWAWLEYPNLQFLYLSYSDKLAGRDHVKSRRLIESPWYQTRWADKYNLAHDQNTKVRYDNDKGGYRATTSLTGTVTGDGGDIVVIDDPNSASDVSDAGLDSVESFWTDTMPTRLNDAKTGRRIIIQQRLHERDLTGIITAAKDHGFVHLILPMEFEANRRSVTVVLPSTNGKKWADPRKKDGELLWPERVGEKELKKLKRELKTEYNISGQLQQRPAPGEGGMIKRKWFRIHQSENTPKIKYIVQSWDTALSEKKEAAFNACTTWGIFDDDHELPNMILLAAWRKRCEYHDLREHAKRLSKNYLDDSDLDKSPKKENKALRPDLILVEDKTTGKILIRDLRKAGVTVTAFNPDRYGDKTQRVRFAQPTLQSGHVWVPGLAPSFTTPRYFASVFISQCASFPKAASRDLVDTMTQAVLRMQDSGWIWIPDDPDTGRATPVEQQIPEAIY